MSDHLADAATMVGKHMPGFVAIADQFEVLFRPPATIVLLRPGDPDGAAITYAIPALLIPASYPDAPKQIDMHDPVEAAE